MGTNANMVQVVLKPVPDTPKGWLAKAKGVLSDCRYGGHSKASCDQDETALRHSFPPASFS